MRDSVILTQKSLFHAFDFPINNSAVSALGCKFIHLNQICYGLLLKVIGNTGQLLRERISA